MITKEDGEITLATLPEDHYKNFLKYNAYKGWPGSFLFVEKKNADGTTSKTRIIITEASFENGEFIIKKFIPEGRKEMDGKELHKQTM